VAFLFFSFIDHSRSLDDRHNESSIADGGQF